MAGKQVAGNEGFTSQLAGMSKNQLYDVMSQMKTLIEQNQQQAKQILVENPLLTKALFQAQIMLGMVQPPQVMPNIQQTLSQQPQQPAQPGQQLNVQAAQSLPVQASSSQPQISARQQHPNQPFIPIPPASVPPATLPLQTAQSHSLQSAQQVKVHLNSQATSISVPQSSQIHNPPPLPHHSTLQPSILQSQTPTPSSQAQQSLPPAGNIHQPLQPPLPPLPRPPSMQPFPPQIHSQMGPNLGFQPPQQLMSQPMFHPGTNPQVSIGSSFPQGQPPLPSQPPPQQLYQVGSHVGTDFSNQTGSSMQVDRGAPWLPGLPENTSGGTQLPGPPPLPPSQMGSTIQPPRPPQLTPEMEKALLQQVMSLTPEQINLLPPEQRNQVLQLQQMLR
ncbi:cleavage stimulating factor 64 [Magnolia sinica]|uniref:cleavage stimulating factor 64 n=1 Tax=Magnolia sinica TaxID=86752 RepID=UPI00265A174D|nr:cleavage stimulating factor 64 [Magnolia sinica]